MITFTHTGDFSKSDKFFKASLNAEVSLSQLARFGQQGVSALSAVTPVNSGVTASSWYYKISNTKGRSSITWFNSNFVNKVPIAIILQYGHGTKNGGYVQGRDYINPALKPIFDKMAEYAWKEVINL